MNYSQQGNDLFLNDFAEIFKAVLNKIIFSYLSQFVSYNNYILYFYIYFKVKFQNEFNLYDSTFTNSADK